MDIIRQSRWDGGGGALFPAHGDYYRPSSSLLRPYAAKIMNRKKEKKFPRKEIARTDFYIHIYVSDLYIPTISLPILLQQYTVGGPILGIYTSLTDV
jgi:hypothetical protein